MTYRTPEQDARLSDLYQERDRVIDYGIKNRVDISLALDGIDAEIETLTTDLDEPRQHGAYIPRQHGAYAPAVGEPVRPEYECPWEDEEREQRKANWTEFFARMNSPEMVERRGTELTPYGWRKVE